MFMFLIKMDLKQSKNKVIFSNIKAGKISIRLFFIKFNIKYHKNNNNNNMFVVVLYPKFKNTHNILNKKIYKYIATYPFQYLIYLFKSHCTIQMTAISYKVNTIREMRTFVIDFLFTWSFKIYAKGINFE